MHGPSLRCDFLLISPFSSGFHWFSKTREIVDGAYCQGAALKVGKNREFCIKNEELRIEKDEFVIKRDEFIIKRDEF